MADAGLSADYRTETIPGRLMRSKETGQIMPAIRRMVEDGETEPSCVLLTQEEATNYLTSLSSNIPSPAIAAAMPTKEIFPDGIGELFIKAFITDSVKKKILSSDVPYDTIEKIVKVKATMISDTHWPALTDQIAVLILAENMVEETE